MNRPDLSSLGQWLASWIQSNGSINGFHNHSVWGDNPFRYGDFTAGHSTFTSPFLMGIATALQRQPDIRGTELLKRMVGFQISSRQLDGQFAHVGFQGGEMIKEGLIHNMVPCVALTHVAQISGIYRPEIDTVVRRVISLHDSAPNPESTCNQAYCLLWAKLLHMEAFDHRQWHDQTIHDLEYMIKHFHVRGMPDLECAGALRVHNDIGYLEPSEYYGLMIHPLIAAYCRYEDTRYLQEAKAFARHCIRSAWSDRFGRRRAHRLWTKTTGDWRCLTEPMLIGGIGLTLSSIERLQSIAPSEEFSSFLKEMDETYLHYQSAGGFFLAATGWGSEQDIIPSTAWQSHDFFHLTCRHPLPEGFWDRLFSPHTRVSAVFGQSMIWIETEKHWAVRGYKWADGLQLIGRKDRETFGRDFTGWKNMKKDPGMEFLMPEEPAFLRDKDSVFRIDGRNDVDILSGDKITYVG